MWAAQPNVARTWSTQRKIATATLVERTQSFLAKKFIEIVREEYPAG